MIADDRQKRVWKGRLLALPAVDVFNEIRHDWPDRDDYPDEASNALEAELLQRCEPLVDLALGGYGRDAKVVAAVYERARRPSSAMSATLSKDIRIACLSNRNVSWQLLARFPSHVLGEAETARLLAEGDWDETDALMNNPRLDDELLEALYKHEEVFSTIDDDRWNGLVYRSATNPRLNTDRSDMEGPDLGLWRIQGAIVTLLEKAPRTMRWLHTLYHLLNALNPSTRGGLAAPERLEPLIDWPPEAPRDAKRGAMGGYFTELTLTDEFRCVVAALYGRSFVDGKSRLAGSLEASDVALRCAYYGNGELTERQINAAAKRDGAVFALAAMCNDSLLLRPKLRHSLEKHLGGQLARRYRRRCEQLHERWQHLDPRPTSDWLSDDPVADTAGEQARRLQAIAESVAAVDGKLAALVKEGRSAIGWLSVGIIAIVALLVWFKQ